MPTDLSSQSRLSSPFYAIPATDHATSPSILTPTGMVDEKYNRDRDSQDESSSVNGSECARDNPVDFDAVTVDYLNYDEAFHASLPDLNSKKSISVYTLPPKVFDSAKPTFYVNETVPIIVKTLYYLPGNAISLQGSRDKSEWTARSLVVEFETGPTHLLAKEHSWWSESSARARSEAFGRAQSNRYPFYVLQHISDPSEEKSQWLIAESATDTRNHRYVHEYEFYNKNYTMKVDKELEDVIYAFLHYTYKMSGCVSLIAQLDCDSCGKISNLVCFTKVRPPDSLCFRGMFNVIEMASVHFERQHKCNDVCHTLGLIPFKPFE
ncbi:hypothetical protein DFH28DRAFT_928010 [Melampsora americana]|nr:hypothetical protein DFH28DRAFT_928010 [Melampsora americana]